jgi:hypothetical protein
VASVPRTKKADPVRAFACPECSSLVCFENTQCLACGTPLGYLRPKRTIVGSDDVPGWQRCGNLTLAQCNSLAEEDAPGGHDKLRFVHDTVAAMSR